MTQVSLYLFFLLELIRTDLGLVELWHLISKAFDRVCYDSLLHKLKPYGSLSNRRLRVVLDVKSSQEYPVNAGVPQAFILGPTLS